VAPKKPGGELAGIVRNLDIMQKIEGVGRNPRNKG
jgi:hypothetical protein